MVITSPLPNSIQWCLKLGNQCIPLLCKLIDFQHKPSFLHPLRTTTEVTASRWVPKVCVTYTYRWQMNTVIFPVTSLAAVSVGRSRMLIAQCAESLGKLRWCCPEPFLVLLSNIRAGVGGLNKSTANLAALAQPPSDCAIKAAQVGIPSSLVSEDERSISRTHFLSLPLKS